MSAHSPKSSNARGMPDARERLEQRRARRRQAGVAALPERRVRRQGEQERQVDAHAVGDADRDLRVGQPDVHVQRERRLAARERAHGPMTSWWRAPGATTISSHTANGCVPATPAVRSRPCSRLEMSSRSVPSSSIAPPTESWTPVVSSTAAECVSELTLVRMASGSASSTSSIDWASAPPRGWSSMTSSSTPTVYGGHDRSARQAHHGSSAAMPPPPRPASRRPRRRTRRAGRPGRAGTRRGSRRATARRRRSGRSGPRPPR